jgi:hypothetical protein
MVQLICPEIPPAFFFSFSQLVLRFEKEKGLHGDLHAFKNNTKQNA